LSEGINPAMFMKSIRTDVSGVAQVEFDGAAISGQSRFSVEKSSGLFKQELYNGS
jgi:hypothetical protein